MGTYAPRPDGLYSLDYGDGSPPLPIGLSEMQLQAAGHQPAAPGGAQAGDPALTGLDQPPPASFFQGPRPDALPSLAEQQGAHGLPPPPPPPEAPRATPGAPAPKGTHPTPRNVPNAAGGQIEGHSAQELESMSTPKADIAPEELVAYKPPSGGTGGEASVSAPRAASAGGGAAPKVPKDQILPGLKRELENDQRPERQLEGAFERFYGETDARLAREEQLAERQKDIDAQQLQRAAVDEDIRRKRALVDQREKEAEQLKPKSASEIWKDRGVAAQIGAAIMVGLGGYAQGLVAARGGHLNNAALDGINAGIQQEIQDQRFAYEAALAKGKRAENDYEKAIAIYGTPEAAALDMKVRSYALADSIAQAKQQAIGTQDSLNNAIQLNQAMRIEREKAKQELYELERIKALRAAQAAGGGGQAEALARQGIVKIGKDFYTVDKKSGQWVPLDKAAELAGKARGGPTAQKADSVVATIDVLGNRLSKKPKNGEVFSPDNQNIVTRGVRSAVNAVAGDRTILPGSQKQREEANEFDQIKNDLMSQTSVINGQGAMSDPEAKRATDAIGQARTWGELQRAQRYLRDKAAAAASAYDGEEPPATP